MMNREEFLVSMRYMRVLGAQIIAEGRQPNLIYGQNTRYGGLAFCGGN